MLCRQYAQHTTYAIDETMHLWKLPIIENREVTKSQKTIGLENAFAPVVQLFIGRVRYLETQTRLNDASFSRTSTKDTNVYQLFSTAANTFICTARVRVHVRIQVNYSTASGQGLRVLPSTKCLLYRRCLSNDHRSYELLDISTISHKPGFHETHVNGSIRVFTLIEVTMKLERVSSSHSAECLRDDREIWIPSGFGVSACNLCPSTLL